jgi:hypothetical protein
MLALNQHTAATEWRRQSSRKAYGGYFVTTLPNIQSLQRAGRGFQCATTRYSALAK